MNPQGLWRGLIIVVLIALPLLFGTACDQGDDDDDNGPSAVDQITAVVEEMTAGYMARTEEALEEQVFPHISASYEHAGFDKDAYMADALEDLEENPDTVFDDYELTVEVTMQGVDNDTIPVAETHNVITATLLANEDDGRNFDTAITGESNGSSNFMREGEDGEWQVTGGEARYSAWQMHGGDEAFAVDTDNIALDAEDIAPGGQAHLTGTLDLPEIGDDQAIFLLAVLAWEDDRNNAQEWAETDESFWRVELTADAGATYDLDVLLPDDGEPAELAIPDSLPLGIDTIEAQMLLFVADVANDGTMTIVRLDGKNFSLPYRPLANADPCPASLSADVDGIWQLQVDDGDEAHHYADFSQLFDVRQVGNDLYGTVVYAAPDEEDGLGPALLEVTGEVSGDTVSFAFSNEDLSVTYEATLNGAQMTEGTVTYITDAGTFAATFTGQKLDNRCVGILPELDGKQLAITAGGAIYDFAVSGDGIEVLLIGEGTNLLGYVVRNVFLGIDQIDADHWWFLLGFQDESSGFAYVFRDDVLSEGTFIVH